MTTRTFRSAALFGPLIAGTIIVPAADARKEDAAVASRLITAVLRNDHTQFAAVLPAFTKDLFESVYERIGSRLKGGYTLTHLGDLKQQGHRITLWKISCKDGSDDALVMLTFKDEGEGKGSVAGFFVR